MSEHQTVEVWLQDLFGTGQAELDEAVYSNVSPQVGIFLQFIAVPEAGAVAAYYCKKCRTTTFETNVYAIKPEKGDYFKIQFCPDFMSHNFCWPKFLNPMKESSL